MESQFQMAAKIRTMGMAAITMAKPVAKMVALETMEMV
jgi:hypothetical protein